MASSTERRPELSDEQFERLVALIADADSVELKLTVPERISRRCWRSGWILWKRRSARCSSSTHRISCWTGKALWFVPVGCRRRVTTRL